MSLARVGCDRANVRFGSSPDILQHSCLLYPRKRTSFGPCSVRGASVHAALCPAKNSALDRIALSHHPGTGHPGAMKVTEDRG